MDETTESMIVGDRAYEYSWGRILEFFWTQMNGVEVSNFPFVSYSNDFHQKHFVFIPKQRFKHK